MGWVGEGVSKKAREKVETSRHNVLGGKGH